MKIKSTVLQVLAAASLGAGLLYAMGIEGGAQLGGMGESTLSTRLNPKPEQKNNEWRHYEITAICRELHIPQEQIGEYFFPKVEEGA